VFRASRPSRRVVAFVALGLPGEPPKGDVPRKPPRGVLRDWSRPVPGSCRGVVAPLTEGFPHKAVVRAAGRPKVPHTVAQVVGNREALFLHLLRRCFAKRVVAHRLKVDTRRTGRISQVVTVQVVRQGLKGLDRRA